MKIKITILVIILVIILLITGAYYFFFQEKRIDIAEKPEYLYSETFYPSKITLYGIGIRDKESKIDPSLIEEEKNSAGWINMKSDVGYRVADGKVVEMALRGTMIEKLGLLREEEIIIKFGKPDKIEERTGFLSGKNYLYIDKGLIIRVNDSKNIVLINIIGK